MMRLVFPRLKIGFLIGEGYTSYSVTSLASINESGTHRSPLDHPTVFADPGSQVVGSLLVVSLRRQHHPQQPMTHD
ncbi:MAG: hypothetical protein U0703_27210 [Anaerolineae bacterium]